MRIKWQGKRNLRLKLIISAIFMLVGAAIASWALGYGQNNNSDGLVLDIDFSADNYDSATRTFKDKSGNNNHAVSTNVATFAPDKDGKSNGAVAFNGTSDEIASAYDYSAVQNVTYSVWFNRLSSTGVRTIIGSEGDTGTIRLSNSTLQGFWDPTTNSMNSGKAVSGNEWHHLVVVKTSNQLNVYLDGTLFWSPAINDIAISNVKFGRQGTRVDRNWAGLMSNVRIFERAFSDIEVKKLFVEFKPKFQVSSIQKGLIGHWSLYGDTLEASGRVTDLSGYSNHGTNFGAVITNDRAGNLGGAMHFNGIDNRIAINYPNPIKQTSVVAWFRSTGEPAGGFHIVTGASVVEISIHTSGYLRTGVVTDTQARKVFNSGSGLTDGKWHMVSLTYDGVNLKSWIDGVVTATNPVSGNLTGVAREIGRYQSNTYVTNGDIADVRIYNRAISEEEIVLLFNSYNPPILGDSLNKGLVVDLPLDANSLKGTTFSDSSAYSNNAYKNNGGTVNIDSFDLNASGSADLGHNDSINQESFTVSFWGNYRNYAYPRTFGAVSKSSPVCYFTGGKGWDFGHGYNPNGVDVCINDGVTMIRGQLTFNAGNRPPSVLNTWVHIVYVVDRSTNKVGSYVNGIKQAHEIDISTITGSIKNNSTLRIGTLYGWQTDGQISDFKMYNRPLTAQEVKTLYDRGRGNSGAVLNGL